MALKKAHKNLKTSTDPDKWWWITKGDKTQRRNYRKGAEKQLARHIVEAPNGCE